MAKSRAPHSTKFICRAFIGPRSSPTSVFRPAQPIAVRQSKLVEWGARQLALGLL